MPRALKRLGLDQGAPEAIPAPLRYRFAAMFYDALFVFALWVFTTLPTVLISGKPIQGVWYQAVLALELYAYFAGFWVLQGQTIGMRVWRLRLRSEEAFGWFDALRRMLAGAAGLCLLGLGYFWMYLDDRGKTWPDLASGSETLRHSSPSISP